MSTPTQQDYEERVAAIRERMVQEEVGDLGLFAGAASFPTRPAVEAAEQRALPLPETPEALYAVWRAKPESKPVIDLLRKLALQRVAKGDKAIGPRGLWEEARGQLKRSVDNRLQALACREVEDTTPALKGLFRHRHRAA